MTSNDNHVIPTHDEAVSGAEKARQMADAEHGFSAAAHGIRRWIIFFVAIAWSAFQLSIASWLIVDSLIIRAVHLAFAMVLIFLSIPSVKPGNSNEKPGGFLGFFKKITPIDALLALAGAVSALYIVYDYAGMAMRYGFPNTMDLVMGVICFITLLEATRRVIGPALPIIALGFTVYAFFGPYMPEVIAFKGVSLNRFVGQMTMSTEGIYGIPLDVSATIVFLFVLFGTMLEKAGAGDYFIRIALCLLGGFRGGPAKAAILGSGLTGMVSGSSIANIVTTGTFTIPLMKKVGYPPTKAAAIEVAASTDGQLAPPIMGAAAFIIAEYVNVPYIAVIKAAAVPAFASYAALLYISHIEACKLGLQGIPRKELPPFFSTLISGLHFLLPLAVLLYELIALRHSPELAAFNAIWVLSIVMLLQGPIKAYRAGKAILPAFKQAIWDLLASLSDGAKNMASVAMATAAAGIIVGVVAMGLGGLITQIIDQLSGGNIYLMLIITAIASLIIGMGLPTTATYIVMASLTAPAIVTVGGFYGFAVPLIAAHLFCFFFGILADDTPPVGLAAYAAAAIAESPPIQTGLQGFMYDIRTAILPFMFIFNHDLILWNVDSWGQGLFIFAMACVANFAFASATQGWLTCKNRIYEIPFLLLASFIMFRPYLIAEKITLYTGITLPHPYFAHILGLAVFGLVYLMQKPRAKYEQPEPVLPQFTG